MKKRILAWFLILSVLAAFPLWASAEETVKPSLEYGEVLYQDPLTTKPAGTPYTVDSGEWTADEEGVRLECRYDNWYVLDGTDGFDDECIVSIDLTLLSEYGAVGIGIRKSGDPNLCGYDIDWLTTDGVLSLHRPFGGYDTANPEIVPETGVEHNLTVVMDGYLVDIYVDGELINTLYADLYSSGGSLALFGFHCTALFRNLTVYRLPKPETEPVTEAPITQAP